MSYFDDKKKNEEQDANKQMQTGIILLLVGLLLVAIGMYMGKASDNKSKPSVNNNQSYGIAEKSVEIDDMTYFSLS